MFCPCFTFPWFVTLKVIVKKLFIFIPFPIFPILVLWWILCFPLLLHFPNFYFWNLIFHLFFSHFIRLFPEIMFHILVHHDVYVNCANNYVPWTEGKSSGFMVLVTQLRLSGINNADSNNSTLNSCSPLIQA